MSSLILFNSFRYRSFLALSKFHDILSKSRMIAFDPSLFMLATLSHAWAGFWKCLWTKGETSGNYLELVSIKTDCDNDTLLIRAIPHGPTCHTGTDTCWGEDNKKNPVLFLTELQDFINKRHEEMPENSYTTSLFKDGTERMAQKVGEEALEAVIGDNKRLIYESSDMLYHLIVLLTSKGLRIEQVISELAERHQPGWHKH